MSIVDGGPGGALVTRVRDILLQPGPTWETIESESATIQGLYTGYVAILAAIAPLIGLLWGLAVSPIFGLGAPLVLAGQVIEAVVGYAIVLAGVYAFAWIADRLASNFGATPNLLQAFKVGAYGMTAAWVSGIFLLVPVIGPLGVLAGLIYSIYLVHLGLTRLMKPAEDKAVAYTAITVIATTVVMALANAVLEAVT